ncbi:ferredoxin--NADP(+) reductase [Candidatus Pantoea edessiphila]|uniref:Flavodoxin/ferredoxin--NADP reductase n=1 Tax=Candidatus Pantoea edessiphila TaxID=2044610 RepID=A0A2P5SZ08_9GAMM|nr:ferredoxin--NADP(+) reductase [Candidatus Pantoea edessiphila]MBK4775274.1 ferredoxin--NADP(+) reductase [Pantoea sp. Edef]PPI87587.1 ferredoxin--NADP(+) reductase [Candidatus Pantoea edessiphila]
MSDWVNAQVHEIKNWTNDLFSLRIKAPICPFIAGQFTKIALELDGKRIQRAYSYVNSPDDEILEFYLTIVPEGKLSPYLHILKPGKKLMITKKACGSFVLDSIPQCKNLWMLSTGTAIGPYLSILQYGKDLDRFENIILVHATRYSADLSFSSLIKNLQKKYIGKLHFQTVVSREKTPESLCGRIPYLISNSELENAIKLDINAQHSHVMLCGNPGMVHETQQLLKNTRGMQINLKSKPGHITSENYW